MKGVVHKNENSLLHTVLFSLLYVNAHLLLSFLPLRPCFNPNTALLGLQSLYCIYSHLLPLQGDHACVDISLFSLLIPKIHIMIIMASLSFWFRVLQTTASFRLECKNTNKNLAFIIYHCICHFAKVCEFFHLIIISFKFLKIQSLCTHPLVISNLYGFLLKIF